MEKINSKYKTLRKLEKYKEKDNRIELISQLKLNRNFHLYFRINIYLNQLLLIMENRKERVIKKETSKGLANKNMKNFHGNKM